jgi:hypothetical protein
MKWVYQEKRGKASRAKGLERSGPIHAFAAEGDVGQT